MELSSEQRAAVFTESKTALCLAGAGSGKTRVLTSRIHNLLENCNLSPYEIMSITFTRKAGKEMVERLDKLIGNRVHKITIGTLHSVALKYIQRFGEFIGLNPGKITVYSSWEEGVLLKDVCRELGYYNGKSWKGVKKGDIDAAFHLFYTRKVKNERDYIPNEIMEAFFLRCKENNALTYGMIMTSFLDLVPKISKMLRFKHILVDEVQDLDQLQWRIVKLICSVCDASLFVVGDDSQSIYSFRGADPDYLIRNQGDFDIYKLRDNYRSDSNIVNAANKLIKHNVNRLDLEMNPIREGLSELNYWPNMDSEKILENIKLVPEINECSSVCVLGRNHFLLTKLSSVLESSGIDHEYIGMKTVFIRSEEFRRVHAFLNLAVNPFDNFSFMLCREILEVDKTNYKDIRLKAVMENKSHFQVFAENTIYNYWTDTFAKLLIKQNLDSILKYLRGFDFGFDPDPVVKFIFEYISTSHEPTIAEYLEWLALFDVQDEIKEVSNKLQLMTIHASKGLEFSTVLIAGLNNGILPSSRSKSNQRELESERRLAYVAYTRAKDNLILTSRPVNIGAKTKCPPSQFINESL